MPGRDFESSMLIHRSTLKRSGLRVKMIVRCGAKFHLVMITSLRNKHRLVGKAPQRVLRVEGESSRCFGKIKAGSTDWVVLRKLALGTVLATPFLDSNLDGRLWFCGAPRFATTAANPLLATSEGSNRAI